MKKKSLTIYDIKYLHESNTKPALYFSRSTMKFFHQTLKMFHVKKLNVNNYYIYANMYNNEGKKVGISERVFNTINNELHHLSEAGIKELF